MTIKALRTPEARFENLPGWPYQPRYVDDLPGYEGLRMHYVDVAPEDGPKDGPVFLCIHGEPTWAYLFRKMIPVFVEAGGRAVAVDMFGFGRSDKPADDETYTYHFHRNALLAFVERLDLKDVCLVVQDWGGVLGLTLPMEAPARYTRLIVMNTGLPAGEEAPEGFAMWRAFNRSQPDLDVAGLMKRATPILSDEEAAAYAAPFPDQSYKGGVRRFPELVMLKEKGAADLTPLSKEGVETSLRARKFWLEEWAGESFMAIGMQDPVLGPPAMHALRKFIRGCPEPMEVAEGGHFVQEWGAPIAREALKRFALA
ncbi:haloalkane dehalogenase [Amphiplicatus metriothermophilus]|uniref:Haloalkane dehalogenase n=1 Tax=Amphiplicatus metriothermophilus TaxID=1519374 RepID=A0A239PRM9_9PROT|nr:haloalkane dehalogenase [Amphiplicatus metriothermophilus]MBB5518482.1 pimeloyl-ACP methyl ester carboxylesterase [Amphiplicatus metriothermophilus]SNT72357.1 haloalkane dehalogenase [Amphiplicatus metriothermophilus]